MEKEITLKKWIIKQLSKYNKTWDDVIAHDIPEVYLSESYDKIKYNLDSYYLWTNDYVVTFILWYEADYHSLYLTWALRNPERKYVEYMKEDK